MSSIFFARKFSVRENPNADQRNPVERIRRYEALKARWIEQNPEATSTDYQRAMTRIACECAV